MAMSGNIFLILIITSYGSAQYLLYSTPMRSSQGFQRQSLENYYYPPLRYSKRQHLFGNEAAERWLMHDNDKEGIKNEYIYGKKRQLRFGNFKYRPTIKKNLGLERETRYKRNHHQPLELFVRPQHPRRRDVDDMDVIYYDVPQIECPRAHSGLPRFACPSSDRFGRFRCINDHHLCDGFIDCPMAEDEDRQTYEGANQLLGRRNPEMDNTKRRMTQSKASAHINFGKKEC